MPIKGRQITMYIKLDYILFNNKEDKVIMTLYDGWKDSSALMLRDRERYIEPISPIDSTLALRAYLEDEFNFLNNNDILKLMDKLLKMKPVDITNIIPRSMR